MNNQPKVLSVVWNLIRGGTEGQCARLAMAMAARGLTHRVAVFRREGFFLEQVERACGPIHHVDIRRMISIGTCMQVGALARYLQEEQFDLLHAWDCDASIFGAVAARRAAVPLVTSHRDLGEIYGARKLWLMKQADAQARAVVVNAAGITPFVRSLGVPPEKIHRVTNILDLDAFDRLAGEALPAGVALPPGRIVGMVARLDVEKDAETLVRAARLVCAKREEVSFVLAGDGPERKRLEALASSPRIIFLGDVTWVPALLRRCCVGALVPRANEGLSNTILEYMAAGLPVVATDCGGNRELVRDGETGLLVRTGDAQGVADALMKLLDQPALGVAMGGKGRDIVARENKADTVVDAILDVYRRVATTPGM